MLTKVYNQRNCVTVSILDGCMGIATADMDLQGDKWWLARLVVKKPYRGKGLGRELISKLKENARGIPIEVMPGGYDLTKEEQFTFYKKCGFVRQDKHTLMLITKIGK